MGVVFEDRSVDELEADSEEVLEDPEVLPPQELLSRFDGINVAGALNSPTRHCSL